MFGVATLKFIYLGVSDFIRTLFYTKEWIALLYYFSVCTQFGSFYKSLKLKKRMKSSDCDI
jgi:hypothetical protein